MIDVLLVEDDDPKLRQILSFLNSSHPEIPISVARSINAACRCLDKQEFDLILLDMSLPTFDGGKTIGASGRQRTLGGKDLLRYLWELEISTPVYVVTGFKDFPGEIGTVKLPQLHQELLQAFPENYRGHIRFSHNSDSWKLQLSQILGKLRDENIGN